LIRTLNYSIREFPGAYFSINIFVLETLQKWTVYVPMTEVEYINTSNSIIFINSI
jgi:hypothetical protein